MNQKISLLLVSLLTTYLTVQGQRNTIVGVLGTVNNDISHFVDQGNALTAKNLPSGGLGFFIAHEIGKNIFAETGIMTKLYKQGYLFNTGRGYTSSNRSFRALQIPVAASAKINVLENRIFLEPRFGLHFGLRDQRMGRGLGSGSSGEESYTIEFKQDQSVVRHYLLMETGMELEFHLYKELSISTRLSYFNGFKPLSRINYQYTINNSTAQSAFNESQGDYWSMGLGIKYWLPKKGGE